MARTLRTAIPFVLTSALLAAALPFALAAQDAEPRVDLAMVAQIRAEGLQRSRVMDIASYITDVLGARLTLSDDMARAQTWVAGHMRAIGLDHVTIEPFMDYGTRWDNEYVSLHLMEPDYQPMVGYPLSHTPGTNGRHTTRVVIAEIRNRAELEKLRGTLRGASVLSTPPAVVDRARFGTGVSRYTDAELKALEQAAPPAAAPAAPAAGPSPNVVRPEEQMAFYKAEGVVAVLQSESGWPGAVRGFARPGTRTDHWGRAETLAAPPIVAITPEHYNRMYRLRERGIGVTIELEIRNRIGASVEQAHNVVGEISGTDLKDEVVMIGAHFDTWHASPNASDNTSGVAVVLEAMRILRVVGAKPRRTIRAALWAGEEQGLHGSREYVLKHFGDPAGPTGVTPAHRTLSAYFNQDYGPGQYRGIYLQGNEAARRMMTAWTAPFHDLGMTTVSPRGVGSTDHISFDRVGLPGFQFIQDRIGGTGGHTNLDFLDTLPPEDLMRNAVIMASFAYHAGMSDAPVPRKTATSPLVAAGAPAPQAATEAAFARVLADVSAFRARGFTLPLAAGVPARYARRMEDVSERRYDEEARALAGFAERLAAIDRAGWPAALDTDARILSRQIDDRRDELRFRAFEIPIGSREGFHFELPAQPDRHTFDTVASYDDYIAKLQSFGEHAAQRIVMLRAGLKSGRTLPRDVLAGYDEPVAAQIVTDVTQSPLYQPFTRIPSSVPADDRDRIIKDGTAALVGSVIPGLRAFVEFLRREYLPGARATLGLLALPDGAAFYQHRIRMHTTLDLSPREVHDTGLREVARIRAEMERVKARAGFTGSLAAFMTLLQSDPRFTAATEEQYLQAVALAAKRMEGVLPRLFSLLPRTPYGVRPMPERIAIRQSAGYYDAGSADGTRAGWVNINTSDLPARPLYVVESLAFHEGVPGHHLQIMRTQENASLSGFRRGLGITVYTEGWGLYAERLGREVGFYQDPYSDFGRLTYEIWRAVRLVVDSGVHALGWTRADAIAYMAANTGFKLGPSTAEVDRHITEAGQGLAYTFGMLKILDLRARAEARLGTRFDIKAFHEAILRNGPLPLDLLDREVQAWIDSRAANAAGGV